MEKRNVTYVNKVQVANRRVDESFERCRADALNDTRPEHTFVVLVDRAAPGTAGNENTGTNDKRMTLTPDATGGHKKDAGDANTQQVVACQQGHLCKIVFEP